MKKQYIPVIVSLFIIATVVICPLSTSASAIAENNQTTVQYVLTPAEEQVLAEANQRIERYRKGNATVQVVDTAGNPVTNASVHIEMVKHDFLFGCNLFMLDRNKTPALNSAYADSFARLFNYATLPFYWNSYEQSRGVTGEKRLTALANWAHDHNITVKGHPLVWANSVPEWVSPSLSEFSKELKDRVVRETKGFCGTMDFWDVVNEPVVAPQKNNSLGKLMKANTPAAVIADSLGWVRDNCSEAKLVVNDFRNDAAFHRILEEVKTRGGKFDAIGLQSHMHNGAWNLDKVWDICELFKDFNVPLHFTEVTVLSGNLKTDTDWDSYHPGWATTAEGEKAQAEYVPLFYTLLFSHPSVQAITWWDLSDEGAWQGAPAGLIRKDMTPKPAYQKLMDLIHKEWWTDLTVTTDSNGKASWRGFYGEYKVSVSKGADTSDTMVYLKPDADTMFKILYSPVALSGESGMKTNGDQIQPSQQKSNMWIWIFISIILISTILLSWWLLGRKHRK